LTGNISYTTPYTHTHLPRARIAFARVLHRSQKLCSMLLGAAGNAFRALLLAEKGSGKQEQEPETGA